VFCETSLLDIIKEQYYLSKHANIPISDSQGIPDFEREAYLSLIIKDLKAKQKQRK